jgi:7-keto-8-aminopelargonate synthetase-like enzyme
MNYQGMFCQALEAQRAEGHYRIVTHIQFNTVHQTRGERPITVWCSSDYLGMGRHPDVLARCMKRSSGQALAPAAHATFRAKMSWRADKVVGSFGR